MNAPHMAALALRNASRFGTAIVALALTASLAGACAHSVATSQGPAHCADLLAQAFVSQTPIAGAFDCMSPDLQQSARAAGIASDADLAQLAAQPPVYTAYEYKYKRVDANDHKLYYYFEFGPETRCARFHVDSSGHVDDGSWNQGGACPA